MWLQLVTTLPTENATARQRAWRALKSSGAAVLRDGVYLLPDAPECRQIFDEIAADVRAADGAVWLLPIGDTKEDFKPLFDRSEQYSSLHADIASLMMQASSATPESISELLKQARKLRKALTALAAIDFFPGPAREQVESALQMLERAAARVMSPDEPQPTTGQIERVNPAEYQGRLWATRSRPWIDRLASAWLIKRFIDPAARFMWLPHPSDCPPDAVGFDFDGAHFTHIDNRVTFEVLMASFGLEGPALLRLATMVHYLDVGGVQPVEAAGVEALLAGLRARVSDDDQLLMESNAIFDNLHTNFSEPSSRDKGK
jgi:hypothetical protein